MLNDLDLFLNHFAIRAYVNKSASVHVVRGILDREYVEIGDVSTHAPVLTVKTSDIENLELIVGDTLEIDLQAYVIVDFQPDGTGITKMVLQKNA